MKLRTGIGHWQGAEDIDFAAGARGLQMIQQAVMDLNRPVYIVEHNGAYSAARSGIACIGAETAWSETDRAYPLLAYAPRLRPDQLGDSLFKNVHGIRYPYVAGAMANGITSVEMVAAAAKGGMLGFFGAAGLSPAQVEDAMVRLKKEVKDRPFGSNLIHSPHDPALESAIVDLYLREGIRRISASAYLRLTLPIVYYRVKGIFQKPDGTIVCPNKIIAKVSRVEVARRFFSPPPPKLLNRLVEQNMITPEEAALAAHIPMAEDLSAEADSGGHTDNRPALSLLPTMMALKNQIQEEYGYPRPLCVGLGGGIATPESAAAAFAMGAAYVLTGSVNQSCIEAGTSRAVKEMLAMARQADVTMAPAADMFEMGVKVQVLKRGTMFPIRAAKLYDYYNRLDNLDEIPADDRATLENVFFKMPLDQAWEQTKDFFLTRDPRQVERAEKDPKHKMALVFRSYLGQSSRWSVTGDPDRVMDYQIWCGPAMGAFNEWVKGTFLEKPENRDTVTVAMNLLAGAACVTRAGWLRSQGLFLPSSAFHPLRLREIFTMAGDAVPPDM